MRETRADTAQAFVYAVALHALLDLGLTAFHHPDGPGSAPE